jgi:hypothetical protein
MSLTKNSVPSAISNLAAFNVTTSLVEDSTHVNLRVRADVYHEGIVKAVVEKPKGIADFDFADILKSLTPGLKFAKDSGDYIKTGSIGSNLITGWAADVGTCDVLTTSTNEITRAYESSADATYVKTNDISVTAGKIYLLKVTGYALAGGTQPYFYLGANAELTQNDSIYFANNVSYLLMPTVTGTINLNVGRYNGDFDFSGTFFMYEITTNRTTVGNPLAPYFIKFTEVYENAGVTTAGASSSTDVHRYVPAVGDGTSFVEYVLHDSTSLFANKTLRNTICKFFTQSPGEYHLCFFSEIISQHLYTSKDSAAFGFIGDVECYEGWGVIILNVGELMASVTSSLRLYLENPDSPYENYSETITISVDTGCLADRTVLEFDGLVGGKEYLSFEGVKDLSYATSRNYYTSSTGVKKLISATGVVRQRLETLFKDMTGASYLKSLLTSELVKKVNGYADSEVTVLTDSVKTDSDNMFVNQIEIEY